MRKIVLAVVLIAALVFTANAQSNAWDHSRWENYLQFSDTGTVVLTNSDTSSFTARILARADSSTVLYWGDTTAKILTVSDTVTFTARIAAMPDSSAVLFWGDTTAKILTVSDTASFTARIAAAPDSAQVLFWSDTTDKILTVSDTATFTARILARADSSTVLYWPDTTVALTYTKSLITQLICGTDSFIAANTVDTIVNTDIAAGKVVSLTWGEAVADTCAHIWATTVKDDTIFTGRSGDSDANKTYYYIIQK